MGRMNEERSLYWSSLVDLFERSGQSQRGFAQQHGVSLSTFRNHLYRMRRSKAEQSAVPHQNFGDPAEALGRRVKSLELDQDNLGRRLEYFDRRLDGFDALSVDVRSALDRATEKFKEAYWNVTTESQRQVKQEAEHVFDLLKQGVHTALPAIVEEHVNDLLVDPISHIYKEHLETFARDFLEDFSKDYLGNSARDILNDLREEHLENLARNLWEGFAGEIAERTEELEEEFARKLTALEGGLANDLERVEEGLTEDLSNMIAGAVDTLAKGRIADLSKKVDRLGAAIQKISGPPDAAIEIENRIRAAQVRGKTLSRSSFRSPLEPESLKAALRRQGFYLSERVCSELIAVLETRKLLVLEGVPGTGKTRLAEHLAQLLLPDVQGSKYSKFNVFPEATTWHSIGGLRMLASHFIPHLGWLTDAVLSCIEMEGCHWLILDEMNRGDISALLAPVLDALEPSVQGEIMHPNLFPTAAIQSGSVPIPGTFRIIGTRNPFDSDVLYEVTYALDRRMGVIRIDPLTDQDEADFLDARVIFPCLRQSSQALTLEAFKRKYNIEEAFGYMRSIISGIRQLAYKEPRYHYQHCEIGTSWVVEMAERICRDCVDLGANEQIEVVDTSISELLPRILRHFGTHELMAAVEVFEGLGAVASAAVANKGLSR